MSKYTFITQDDHGYHYRNCDTGAIETFPGPLWKHALLNCSESEYEKYHRQADQLLRKALDEINKTWIPLTDSGQEVITEIEEFLSEGV